MYGLDTGMQYVTMQHISSKDILVEDFHPPSLCILPPKAVSFFPLSSASHRLSHSWVLICSCLGRVFGK